MGFCREVDVALWRNEFCHLPRSGSQDDDAVEGSGNPPEPTAADRFKPQSRHITQVVMVGGATAMPLVQDFVREATGIQPQAIHPSMHLRTMLMSNNA